MIVKEQNLFFSIWITYQWYFFAKPYYTALLRNTVLIINHWNHPAWDKSEQCHTGASVAIPLLVQFTPNHVLAGHSTTQ